MLRMKWELTKLCLRDKFSQNDIDEATGTGYFGVRKNGKGGLKVEVRVDFKHAGIGKYIGKFFKRIDPKEKAPLVVAVFLVDVISHYGGRKSLAEGGGDKDAPDIKHRCFHEIFSKLPSFPEALVQFLNAYIPGKSNVPKPYRKFIVDTWSGHKNEVLRLFDICVAAQRLHPSDQGLTQTATSIAFHGQPEPLTEEMEINEGEASRTLLEQVEDFLQRIHVLTLENERLKISDRDNKKTIVKLRLELRTRSSNMCSIHCNKTTNVNQGLWSDIDECLSDISPTTRAEADTIPSEIPSDEAVPMEEEEMTLHIETRIDGMNLESEDGEQPRFLMASPYNDMFSTLEPLGDMPADMFSTWDCPGDDLGDIPADLFTT